MDTMIRTSRLCFDSNDVNCAIRDKDGIIYDYFKLSHFIWKTDEASELTRQSYGVNSLHSKIDCLAIERHIRQLDIYKALKTANSNEPVPVLIYYLHYEGNEGEEEEGGSNHQHERQMKNMRHWDVAMDYLLMEAGAAVGGAIHAQTLKRKVGNLSFFVKPAEVMPTNTAAADESGAATVPRKRVKGESDDE